MTPHWNLEHANDDLVRVRRLRLLAPADQARGLRAELERVPWPTAPDQSWVLIRGLRVAAPKSALGRRAGERVGDLVRAAVSLDSPGAGSAEAVRCEDLPALLAALSMDLASSRARSRWYWQAWSALFGLPAGLAVANLLGEQPQALAATTERLARRGGLAAVWGALSAADAAQLAERLAGWLGCPLPAPGERPVDRSASVPASADDEPRLPESLLRRWSPVLDGFAWNHPSRWLAACLCTLEWRPLWLSPGAGEAVGWISAVLGGEGADRDQGAFATSARRPPLASTGDSEAGNARSLERLVAEKTADRSSALAAVESGAASAGRLHTPSPGLVREVTADSSFEPWGRVEVPAPEPEPEIAQELDPDSPQGAALDAAEHGTSGPDLARARSADLARVRVSNQARVPQARVQQHPPGVLPDGRSVGAVDPGSDEALGPRRVAPSESQREPLYLPEDRSIASDFGGIFYLINFLSRPEAQVRLATQTGFPRHEHGWAWLWDLGMRLGLKSEPALDAFFAERLGLEHPGDLRPLPQLPIGAELFDLGEHLYGADTFNATLLRVPARLRHTASHLDLDLPLASVRLEVRRVALDVDPGWVPWLGRVVRFHYRERWDASDGGVPR